MYIYDWFTSLYGRSQHNILKQYPPIKIRILEKKINTTNTSVSIKEIISENFLKKKTQTQMISLTNFTHYLRKIIMEILLENSKK